MRWRNSCTSIWLTESTGRSALWNGLGLSPITASLRAWVQGASNSQKPWLM
jgi:hypothetical protein